MSQDLINSTQDSGSTDSTKTGNTSTTGFATGTTCTSSGTYRAENRYMRAIQVYAAGEIFGPFLDGKKTTWYVLSSTSTTTSTSDGSFDSVLVEAGTV